MKWPFGARVSRISGAIKLVILQQVHDGSNPGALPQAFL
jgi:hypothetical protein